MAGAMGDSLGAEIEFWPLDRIAHQFPNGLRELPQHQGIVGAITDDTQMTLFTAEGLIRSWVRGRLKGIVSVAGVVHHALLRWLCTQGVEATVTDADHVGLVEDARLHHRRAPGNTCLSSLGSARHFGEPARNDSKGCGTIMRVAPVAFGVPTGDIRQVAIATSALTHGHATGQLAAAAWAELLHSVFLGEELEQTAVRLLSDYRDLDNGSETADAIEAALYATRDGSPETVELLGGGWVAEEALSIALYSALATSNLEDGLRCAVTHSGDSDSTGAVAGNLLGLLYPDQVFEHPWSNQIECRDLILRLARDLVEVQDWSNEFTEEQFAVYPGV
ncbi:ADP-ribosylglycohydrolase family protein [Dichotomicrobium thermohalophilum]|uniref:ADP-ribosylglycohydrolase family protein n=1 Tax=Dichotomicrobium thermohalophilum TaxID=933063 RepID=UPI002478E054|nr:ADP-ribosylglycohydrolase family protein [Dichotomicrobium thermohalophilum]